EGHPTLARPAGPIERTISWCRRKPALAGSIIGLVVVGLAGLAGILWQWRRAEAESLKFQFRSYIGDMDLANRAVDEGDLGTAKGLVRRYWPESHQADLRNWEWHYLANLSEGDPHFPLVAHSSGVWSLGFLDDNTLLTAASADWRTVLWDLKEHRPSKIITNGGFGGSVADTMVVAPKRNAMFFRPAWSGATHVTLLDLQNATESKLLDADGPVTSLDI